MPSIWHWMASNPSIRLERRDRAFDFLVQEQYKLSPAGLPAEHQL